MKTIKQVFKLGKDINEYNDMVQATENMSFTKKEAVAYQKKLDKLQGKIQEDKSSIVKSAMSDGISSLRFIYDYNKKTARFGLRGQDVQDQLALQDKAVNTAFGFAGALVVGGPYAAVAAAVATVIGEVVSTNIQNKAYEYQRMIDEEQKAISQERIGRAVYNSSRRV